MGIIPNHVTFGIPSEYEFHLDKPSIEDQFIVRPETSGGELIYLYNQSSMHIRMSAKTGEICFKIRDLIGDKIDSVCGIFKAIEVSTLGN